MSEEIFKSQCPIFDCSNTKIIDWHHKGCPALWDVYITNKAILKCGKCGEIDEFFNCRFDCGSHFDEAYAVKFKYPTTLKKVLAIIGALEDDGIYSTDFVDLLVESLRKQYRKKNR